MKRKRNIYDADDAAKSKRLHFQRRNGLPMQRKRRKSWEKSWKKPKLTFQRSAVPGSTGNLTL